MTENSPKLVIDAKLWIQVTQRKPNNQYMYQKSTSRDIMFKLQGNQRQRES